MEESEAIELMKMKKPQGLAWLVEKYQLRAVRAAYLITQDATLAEDVVQDKFVDLYRNVHSFDATRPFAPWFFRCVVNAAISATRSERKYAGKLDLQLPSLCALSAAYLSSSKASPLQHIPCRAQP